MAKGFTAFPLFVFFLASGCVQLINPLQAEEKIVSISPIASFNQKKEAGSPVLLLNQNGPYLFDGIALMSLWITYCIARSKTPSRPAHLQMDWENQTFFSRVCKNVNRIWNNCTKP